jgi:GAF domain-containing protein
MDEAEWLACSDARRMLEYLRDTASERKLRLFGCACCRRIWHLLSEVDSRTAVEVAEKFADGLERKSTLATARSRARRLAVAQRGAAYSAWRAAFEKIRAAIVHLALGTVWSASYKSWYGIMSADMDDVEREEGAVVALLREIFDNPFSVVPFDPNWRTQTVRRLAQAAYDEPQLPSAELKQDRLAILADALEDAGCSEPRILSHLRGPGPHMRGCFVTDLLLDKN